MIEQKAWITSSELSDLACISPRAAQYAFKQPSWRGSSLNVKDKQGVGGKSGVVTLVHVDSLPVNLRDKYYLSTARDLAVPSVVQTGVTDPAHGTYHYRMRIALWRFDLIRDALAHPKEPTFKCSQTNWLVYSISALGKALCRTTTRCFPCLELKSTFCVTLGSY